jgi:hypothetical protein
MPTILKQILVQINKVFHPICETQTFRGLDQCVVLGLIRKYPFTLGILLLGLLIASAVIDLQ